MRILIACEFSGIVRDAFIAQGHDAVSCDIIDTESPGPHIKGDAIEAAYDQPWDMMIAHPPCTYLSNSGVRWLYKANNGGIDIDRWTKMCNGAWFFRALLRAPIERVAVENPVIHKHAKKIIGAEPSQLIQPWQFGHPESKATCLWLKNLPMLLPTNIIDKPERGYWDNQTPSGQNKLSPSPTRAKERSVTYKGIAEAMANQWGRS